MPMRYVWIVYLLLIASSTHAQLDRASEPHYKRYEEEINIELVDGEPLVVVTTDIDIYYPSETATRMLPYYYIMLSSYDELLEVNVTIRNARGRKTYLDQNDMEISEGTSDDYFVNGSKEYKINFKNLEPGSRVKLSYEVATTEVHFFQPLYFRHFLSAEVIKYTLSYPKGMDLKLVEKNLAPYEIYREDGQTFKKNLIVYTAVGQPSVEVFDDGPSVPYYTPHVIPILRSYTYEDVLYPVLRSPDDLYHWYDSIVYTHGDASSPELEVIASSIRAQSDKRDSIIKNTYQWVQKNIRYVAYEAGDDGVIPRAPKKVCQRKFGDCKDMSYLIRKLLLLNGINSNLTWIGTRRIPYTYDEVYTMNTDNHMILSVPVANNQWMLLDATDPSGIYGLPTAGIQSKQAMIGLTHDSYELYEVPIVSPNQNEVYYQIDIQMDDDVMKLQTDMRSQGLNAGQIKNVLLYSSGREKEQLLKDLLDVNSNKTELDKSEVIEEGQDLRIKTKHTVDGRIKKAGPYFFVDPFVNSIVPFGEIDVEDRHIPVQIKMNQIRKNLISVHIPEGHELVSSPEPLSIQHKEFSYTFVPHLKDGILELEEVLEIKTKDLFFSVSYAHKWNDLLTELKKLYRTPIKIQKI